jgi:hypothetical protein
MFGVEILPYCTAQVHSSLRHFVWTHCVVLCEMPNNYIADYCLVTNENIKEINSVLCRTFCSLVFHKQVREAFKMCVNLNGILNVFYSLEIYISTSIHRHQLLVRHKKTELQIPLLHEELCVKSRVFFNS